MRHHAQRETISRRRFLGGVAATGGAALLPACGPAFTPDGLQHLHEVMSGYVDRQVLPGLVTMVSRHGEVHVDAIGRQSVGGAPMRRDTLFRIASMTKPITAVATLMLVEEGKVSLDEPVDRLLPELANRQVQRSLTGPLGDTVPAARPIAVRELLTLTFGTGLQFPIESYPVLQATVDQRLLVIPPLPSMPPPPDEWMRRFGALPLMAQPGERWLYNIGFDILGVLVARASGQPFETYLHDRIFAPLGMKDTAFVVAADQTARLATAYAADPSGALAAFDDPQHSDWLRAPAFPAGASGLVSTVDDYLKFARMLLAKGRYPGGRLLAAASVTDMTTDHLTPAQKAISGLTPGMFDTAGWGYGVSMSTAPDALSPTPGRYGWDGGFGTYWINDPNEDLVAMVLTQRALDAMSPEMDAWKAVYQSLA
jgi:CubicO group peptidase (beta-lactamase class C family)